MTEEHTYQSIQLLLHNELLRGNYIDCSLYQVAAQKITTQATQRQLDALVNFVHSLGYVNIDLFCDDWVWRSQHFDFNRFFNVIGNMIVRRCRICSNSIMNL